MKAPIPKAVREQVWIQHFGKVFQAKCSIHWCQNMINVFDFQCGHNIPESRGGATSLENMEPICSRCNVSMSNNYTIDEWNSKFKKRFWFYQYLRCFFRDPKPSARASRLVALSPPFGAVKRRSRSLSTQRRAMIPTLDL